MDIIYVVVEQHYEYGLMTFVFRSENKAKQYVQDKIKMYSDEWEKQGYTPIVGTNSITVKQHTDSIYADFCIDETELFEGE